MRSIFTMGAVAAMLLTACGGGSGDQTGTVPAGSDSAPAENAGPEDPAPATVAELMAGEQDLSIASELFSVAGFGDELARGDAVAFAPTDAAFGRLPGGALETLRQTGSEAALADLMAFHIVTGEKAGGAGLETGPYVTLNGATVTVSETGGILTVGDAVVVRSLPAAGPPRVYVIDAVLLPPTDS